MLTRRPNIHFLPKRTARKKVAGFDQGAWDRESRFPAASRAARRHGSRHRQPEAPAVDRDAGRQGRALQGDRAYTHAEGTAETFAGPGGH
jgi:hypothetical protein